jgi:hypothetical protein
LWAITLVHARALVSASMSWEIPEFAGAADKRQRTKENIT